MLCTVQHAYSFVICTSTQLAACPLGSRVVCPLQLRDLHMVMEGIDPTEQEQVCSSIRSSSKLAVFGHGMEGTVLKTFARQLCDIGIQVG